jgi:iron(III) transport system substrate-binding protein
MSLIKKLVFCFVAAMVMFSVASCGGGGQGDVVVVYTPFRDEFIRPMVDAFEEETGIRVELTFAGTGVLTGRIRAEAANPIADVLWGGMLPTVIPAIYLFENHTSINEPFMQAGFQNVEGPITRFNLNASVLMVNTQLLPNHIQIRGYADLLHPDLRGRIAMTDPGTSASSFDHLVNQLYAMGNGNPEAGWEYMEAFIRNVNGIMMGSSSAVINSVASGEHWVGLTFEEGPMPHVLAGAPIEVVYMEEGVIFQPDGIHIVRNAPNIDNARRFVDFVTGQYIQRMMDHNLSRRTVRNDIPPGAPGNPRTLRPMSEINVIESDLSRTLANRDAWLARFQQIWDQI